MATQEVAQSVLDLIPRCKLAPPSAQPNPLDRLYPYVRGPYTARLSWDDKLWHVCGHQRGGKPLICFDTEAEAAQAVSELGELWERTAGRKVYFIGTECKEGALVKIGIAYEPTKRLASLQTSWPHPLRILATMPGDATLEKRLHRKFDRVRVRGEWFRITRAMKRLIEGETR